MPGVVARWRAAYGPGDWYVLAGPTSLVVIKPGPDTAAMVAELWPDVVASSSMADLIDRLAGYGLTDLPELGVFFWTAEGMRSLVRGPVEVLDAATGAQLAHGREVITWQDSSLAGVDAVRIVVQPDQPAGPGSVELLPLVVGVARAGLVVLDAGRSAPVVSPQPLGLAAALAVGHDPGPETPVDSGPAEDRAPVEQHSVMAAAGPAPHPVPEEPAAAEHESMAGNEPTAGDEPAAGDEPTAQEPVEVEWGQWAGFGGAAVPGLPVPAAGGGVAGAVAGSATAVEEAATDPLPEVAAPVLDPDEVFAMENDHTQLQYAVGGDSTELMEPPTGLAEPIGTGEPLVEGVRCPRGHANPPGAPACRVCAAPIPPQPPAQLPRPVLARLRASDGSTVELDRAVLIGRAPTESRSDAVLPRLMALNSPGQDISRTHVQVAPDGWQVVVTDLHSTNGTYLMSSASTGTQQLLQPGRPTPVPLGSVLELGEGVRVTIEPPD